MTLTLTSCHHKRHHSARKLANQASPNTLVAASDKGGKGNARHPRHQNGLTGAMALGIDKTAVSCSGWRCGE